MARPPKDGTLHHLHGTASQATAPGESSIAPGRPKVPKGLSAGARKVFRELCTLLEQRRALTPGEGQLLRLYCTLHDRHVRSLAKVAEQGEVVVYTRFNNHGEEVQTEKENLHLKIARDCERQMASILNMLCLTPAARDRARPTRPPKKKAHAPGTVGWLLVQEEEQPEQPAPAAPPDEDEEEL
jgi:P27 family predicted phage terminase small subunit